MSNWPADRKGFPGQYHFDTQGMTVRWNPTTRKQLVNRIRIPTARPILDLIGRGPGTITASHSNQWPRRTGDQVPQRMELVGA